MDKRDTTEFDGGELAIMITRFEAIARRMGDAVMRTGRSGVLNRARDLSACIVSADHELICTANSLPIHVLAGPDMMARSMCEMHPDIAPGDIFLNNSPYHGCSHAADHTVIMPVFDAERRHAFSLLVKAHQADVGNSVPTTYFAAARDVYEEGALIFANMRVVRGEETNMDFVRLCQQRIRAPQQWYGDFLAMLGAVKGGERDMVHLGATFGWDVLRDFVGQWFDYSERRMVAALERLEPGTGVGISVHDPMPGTPKDGYPVRVRTKVDPAQGRIVVDARGNSLCMENGLNLSEACSRTSALIGVFNSIPDNVPKNAGSFRRVDILLDENCAVGIPKHPTSCSASTTNLADRFANAVQLGMADISDGLGMAEFGAINPPSKGVISGVDPRTGTYLINQLFLGSTSGAASDGSDGWLTHSHAGNGGISMVDSVELVELCHPVLVRERVLLQDTEGAGQYIGAPALKTTLETTADSISIAYVSDGSVYPAKGARGGGEGHCASAQLIGSGGKSEPLPNVGILQLNAGDIVVSIGAGGGGYGPPEQRSPTMLNEMLDDDLLSQERARRVYGFVATLGGVGEHE